MMMAEDEASQESVIADEPQELIPKPLASPPPLSLKRWRWWLLVLLNVAFLLIGQAAAVALGKLYFDLGGKSKWMATLVQTAAFPVLFLPLLLFPSPKTKAYDYNNIDAPRSPSMLTVILVYLFIGILLAGDNMLYSVGLWHLPLSTYSLLCATQLAFNALLSFFMNAQKITGLILNAVALLTLSAVLIAIDSDSDKEVTKQKYIIGFICTVLASGGYALLLCLMELSFDRIMKRDSFAVGLDMQIYTSLVATCFCIIGLFASGEGMRMKEDMEGFKKGGALYVLILVGTALAWQISSVGVVGLVFLVSSLFSNVISMLTLPLVPIGAVLLYGDHMDGVKVIAMLLAIWGCSSYFYQQYLDDNEDKDTS